jgi:uroporphyrinogen decarboxylase
MLFGAPDRIPYRFGGPRQSTFAAWYRQGLPQGINFEEFVGMDHWRGLPINLGPVPRFEEVILEETDRYKIWIDYLGAKRLDFKRDPTPGFVTRTWIEFPVKTRDDFREMVKRYDPTSPDRYPADWEEQRPRWEHRTFVLGLTLQSMFWRVRDWVGLEGLCLMFYDNPTLVHEMMEYVADFTIATLERGLSEVDVDYVFFNEDMAYKTASMISPALVKEFIWPRYRKLVRFLREKGVSVLIMDCDGHIGELIPLWLDVGITTVSPIEIAAGNDPVTYRKRYGKNLGMLGGIDKRELRFDTERVRAEVLSKVPWLVEQGGYIPSVDHGVPPDIPVRNYLYMVELIKEIACGGSCEMWEPPGELEKRLGPIEEMWSPEIAWTIPDEEEEGT